MPESATNADVIRIIIPGEARPYTERTRVYRRAKLGARGQPVGSLGVSSYKPQKVENYQARISAFARDAMDGRAPLSGPVRLHVRSFVLIPRSTPKYVVSEIKLGNHHPIKRPDVTNFVKLAEDALTGIVWIDDNQVLRGADDTGRYFSYRPRLEIDVEPINHCPLQAREFAPDMNLAPAAGDLFSEGTA